MKSVMSHNFSRVPAPQIQRSVFDRSCGHKTTFDAGYLIPYFCDEVLPGDTMNLRSTLMGRLSTLIFPIMDNVFLDVFFFFVPSRLLWDNWEKFNGARTNPADSTDYLIPVLDVDPATQFATGSLQDYFGLPTLVNFAVTERISALPFRAFNLIWNEWFRDQNLQNSISVPTTDGPDDPALYVLRRRGKRHDYFTSSLPWPQKGDAVSLPLGIEAPVVGNGTSITFSDGDEAFQMFNGPIYVTSNEGQAGSPTGTDIGAGNPVDTTNTIIGLTSTAANSGMVADLANATAATVDQLREAFAIQKILERDARGGTRYIEMLKNHFGVVSPDFRLQRPEYLGGTSQRVGVTTVPSTSESGTLPQANLSAYGSVFANAGFSRSFVEHGYIIGLVNVRADLTYQYGIDRHWSRSTRYDFYLPALAHLGEQAVLNKEIFYADGGTDVELVWGYQERWAEYRYKTSHVTGLFRSNAAASLDAWHLADERAVMPVLNNTFIQDDPPIDRVIAVPAEPHVIFDSYCSIRHVRPMPVYSVPGQIDRF